MINQIKIALLQLSSNDKPEENYEKIENYLHDTLVENPKFILTPEVSNFISIDKELRRNSLYIEHKDPILKLVKKFSLKYKVWILLGSLALKIKEKNSDIYSNRSLLINPKGKIVARYDKIHMFDIKLNKNKHYQESRYFRPGNKAVLVKTSFANVGMTICYDLRFPQLFKKLAEAGANLICVPSAFTVPTGKDHWEPLLRVRALENKVYILAPAQCGQNGPNRKSWGHSLVIDPNGKIISDSGKKPGICFAQLKI